MAHGTVKKKRQALRLHDLLMHQRQLLTCPLVSFPTSELKLKAHITHCKLNHLFLLTFVEFIF